MKRIVIPALTLLLFSIVPASAGVLRGQPTAKSDGVIITIRWQSDDETGLIGYEIARKAGWDGPYIVLLPLLKAKGNGEAYEFVDEAAFRTTGTFYKYRITGLYSDGHRSDPYETGVSHSVSSVRRTWGSIKAMFR